MKQFWEEMGLAVILGLIVPGIILRIATWDVTDRVQKPAPAEQIIESTREEMLIPVLSGDGQTEQMELDAYLTGVILAEMPASFEKEALKAQAVVARTYTLRACRGKSKHENAAVCTDSACCQGFRSKEDYLDSGGTDTNYGKAAAAVEETAGLVLTYGGELIEATYFSCSGGSTEDAVAVWGTDVPYLKATDSPGEEGAAHYTDSLTLSSEELKSALGIAPEGDPEDWFGAVTYTAGGGVATMVIGGDTFSGTELRSLLGLRSTAFTVEAREDAVVFHTRGYGHRVGMSQYGADAMAAGGSNFEEILAHYYQGTQLERLTD